MKRSIMCIVAFLISLSMLIPANIITAEAAGGFYDVATMVAIKNNIEKLIKRGQSYKEAL